MVPRLCTCIAMLVTFLLLTAAPASAVISNSSHSWSTMVSINNWRELNNLTRMPPNACLEKHAEAWVQYLVKKRELVHRSTASMLAVLKDCDLGGLGENLARGADQSMGTGSQVAIAWMRSPGHKANIVNPKFKVQGAASYFDGNQWWVVSLMARP